jgi:hypothetical protein
VLTIRTAAGSARFREDDVVLIRQRKQDSVWNGIVIGGAIGGGLGLLSEWSCGGYCGHTGVVTLSSAAWGVGVGVLADVLQKSPHAIYRHGPLHAAGTLAVSPLLARRAAGAEIAVRW